MNWKVITASLLITANVCAQELPRVEPEDIQLDPPLQTVPPGEDKIVSLELGKPAPFRGQLFDTNTAMRWGFWLQQWKTRYQLDMAQERNMCAVRMEYQLSVLGSEKARAAKVEKDLETRLLRAEQDRSDAEFRLNNRGFFSSPGFYYALGFVSAGTVAGLSFWAASALK